MKLSSLLAKYSAAGVVNGVLSYSVIFGCMYLGVASTTSNILGYGVGLITSYLQSRYWVFGSSNRLLGEGFRFLLCFLIAFGVNFAVLRLLLAYGINAYLAQVIACVAYVAVGFIINSTYVFARRTPKA
jgi:putative flippase GtrA